MSQMNFLYFEMNTGALNTVSDFCLTAFTEPLAEDMSLQSMDLTTEAAAFGMQNGGESPEFIQTAWEVGPENMAFPEVDLAVVVNDLESVAGTQLIEDPGAIDMETITEQVGEVSSMINAFLNGTGPNPFEDADVIDALANDFSAKDLAATLSQENLDSNLVAAVLVNLPPDTAVDVANLMQPPAMADACDVMEPSDAARLLTGMQPDAAGQVLQNIETGKAAELLLTMAQQNQNGAALPQQINTSEAGQVAAELLSQLPSTNQQVILSEMSTTEKLAVVNGATTEQFRSIVANVSPDEAAQVLAQVAPEAAAAFIGNLEPQAAANILVQLEPEVANRIITQCAPEQTTAVLNVIGTEQVSTLLTSMEPQTAGDYLETQSPETAVQILTAMDPAQAVNIIGAMHPDNAAETLQNISTEAFSQIADADKENGYENIMSSFGALDSREAMELLSSLPLTEQVSLLQQMAVHQAAAILRQYDSVAVAEILAAMPNQNQVQLIQTAMEIQLNAPEAAAMNSGVNPYADLKPWESRMSEGYDPATNSYTEGISNGDGTITYSTYAGSDDTGSLLQVSLHRVDGVPLEGWDYTAEGYETGGQHWVRDADKRIVYFSNAEGNIVKWISYNNRGQIAAGCDFGAPVGNGNYGVLTHYVQTGSGMMVQQSDLMAVVAATNNGQSYEVAVQAAVYSWVQYSSSGVVASFNQYQASGNGTHGVYSVREGNTMSFYASAESNKEGELYQSITYSGTGADATVISGWNLYQETATGAVGMVWERVENPNGTYAMNYHHMDENRTAGELFHSLTYDREGREISGWDAYAGAGNGMQGISWTIAYGEDGSVVKQLYHLNDNGTQGQHFAAIEYNAMGQETSNWNVYAPPPESPVAALVDAIPLWAQSAYYGYTAEPGSGGTPQNVLSEYETYLPGLQIAVVGTAEILSTPVSAVTISSTLADYLLETDLVAATMEVAGPPDFQTLPDMSTPEGFSAALFSEALEAGINGFHVEGNDVNGQQVVTLVRNEDTITLYETGAVMIDLGGFGYDLAFTASGQMSVLNAENQPLTVSEIKALDIVSIIPQIEDIAVNAAEAGLFDVAARAYNGLALLTMIAGDMPTAMVCSDIALNFALQSGAVEVFAQASITRAEILTAGGQPVQAIEILDNTMQMLTENNGIHAGVGMRALQNYNLITSMPNAPPSIANVCLLGEVQAVHLVQDGIAALVEQGDLAGALVLRVRLNALTELPDVDITPILDPLVANLDQTALDAAFAGGAQYFVDPDTGAVIMPAADSGYTIQIASGSQSLTISLAVNEFGDLSVAHVLVTKAETQEILQIYENQDGLMVMTSKQVDIRVTVPGVNGVEDTVISTVMMIQPGSDPVQTIVMNLEGTLYVVEVDILTQQAMAVQEIVPSGGSLPELTAAGEPGTSFSFNEAGEAISLESGEKITPVLDIDAAILAMIPEAMLQEYDLADKPVYVTETGTVFIGTQSDFESGSYFVFGNNTLTAEDASGDSRQVSYLAHYENGEIVSILLDDTADGGVEKVFEFVTTDANDQLLQMNGESIAYAFSVRQVSTDGMRVAQAFYNDAGQLLGTEVTLNNMGGVVLQYDADGNITNSCMQSLQAAGSEGFTFEDSSSGGFVLISAEGVREEYTATGRRSLPSEGGEGGEGEEGGGQQQVLELDVLQQITLNIAQYDNRHGQVISYSEISKRTVVVQLGEDGQVTEIETEINVFGEVVFQTTSTLDIASLGSEPVWTVQRVRGAEAEIIARGYADATVFSAMTQGVAASVVKHGDGTTTTHQVNYQDTHGFYTMNLSENAAGTVTYSLEGSLVDYPAVTVVAVPVQNESGTGVSGMQISTVTGAYADLIGAGIAAEEVVRVGMDGQASVDGYAVDFLNGDGDFTINFNTDSTTGESTYTLIARLADDRRVTMMVERRLDHEGNLEDELMVSTAVGPCEALRANGIAVDEIDELAGDGTAVSTIVKEDGSVEDIEVKYTDQTGSVTASFGTNQHTGETTFSLVGHAVADPGVTLVSGRQQDAAGRYLAGLVINTAVGSQESLIALGIAGARFAQLNVLGPDMVLDEAGNQGVVVFADENNQYTVSLGLDTETGVTTTALIGHLQDDPRITIVAGDMRNAEGVLLRGMHITSASGPPDVLYALGLLIAGDVDENGYADVIAVKKNISVGEDGGTIVEKVSLGRKVDFVDGHGNMTVAFGRHADGRINHSLIGMIHTSQGVITVMSDNTDKQIGFEATSYSGTGEALQAMNIASNEIIFEQAGQGQIEGTIGEVIYNPGSVYTVGVQQDSVTGVTMYSLAGVMVTAKGLVRVSAALDTTGENLQAVSAIGTEAALRAANIAVDEMNRVQNGEGTVLGGGMRPYIPAQYRLSSPTDEAVSPYGAFVATDTEAVLPYGTFGATNTEAVSPYESFDVTYQENEKFTVSIGQSEGQSVFNLVGHTTIDGHYVTVVSGVNAEEGKFLINTVIGPPEVLQLHGIGGKTITFYMENQAGFIAKDFQDQEGKLLVHTVNYLDPEGNVTLQMGVEADDDAQLVGSVVVGDQKMTIIAGVQKHGFLNMDSQFIITAFSGTAEAIHATGIGEEILGAVESGNMSSVIDDMEVVYSQDGVYSFSQDANNNRAIHFSVLNPPVGIDGPLHGYADTQGITNMILNGEVLGQVDQSKEGRLVWGVDQAEEHIVVFNTQMNSHEQYNYRGQQKTGWWQQVENAWNTQVVTVSDSLNIAGENWETYKTSLSSNFWTRLDTSTKLFASWVAIVGTAILVPIQVIASPFVAGFNWLANNVLREAPDAIHNWMMEKTDGQETWLTEKIDIYVAVTAAKWYGISKFVANNFIILVMVTAGILLQNPVIIAKIGKVLAATLSTIVSVVGKSFLYGAGMASLNRGLTGFTMWFYDFYIRDFFDLKDTFINLGKLLSDGIQVPDDLFEIADAVAMVAGAALLALFQWNEYKEMSVAFTSFVKKTANNLKIRGMDFSRGFDAATVREGSMVLRAGEGLKNMVRGSELNFKVENAKVAAEYIATRTDLSSIEKYEAFHELSGKSAVVSTVLSKFGVGMDVLKSVNLDTKNFELLPKFDKVFKAIGAEINLARTKMESGTTRGMLQGGEKMSLALDRMATGLAQLGDARVADAAFKTSTEGLATGEAARVLETMIRIDGNNVRVAGVDSFSRHISESLPKDGGVLKTVASTLAKDGMTVRDYMARDILSDTMIRETVKAGTDATNTNRATFVADLASGESGQKAMDIIAGVDGKDTALTSRIQNVAMEIANGKGLTQNIRMLSMKTMMNANVDGMVRALDKMDSGTRKSAADTMLRAAEKTEAGRSVLADAIAKDKTGQSMEHFVEAAASNGSMKDLARVASSSEKSASQFGETVSRMQNDGKLDSKVMDGLARELTRVLPENAQGVEKILDGMNNKPFELRMQEHIPDMLRNAPLQQIRGLEVSIKDIAKTGAGRDMIKNLFSGIKRLDGDVPKAEKDVTTAAAEGGGTEGNAAEGGKSEQTEKGENTRQTETDSGSAHHHTPAQKAGQWAGDAADAARGMLQGFAPKNWGGMLKSMKNGILGGTSSLMNRMFAPKAETVKLTDVQQHYRDVMDQAGTQRAGAEGMKTETRQGIEKADVGLTGRSRFHDAAIDSLLRHVDPQEMKNLAGGQDVKTGQADGADAKGGSPEGARPFDTKPNAREQLMMSWDKDPAGTLVRGFETSLQIISGQVFIQRFAVNMINAMGPKSVDPATAKAGSSEVGKETGPMQKVRQRAGQIAGILTGQSVLEAGARLVGNRLSARRTKNLTNPEKVSDAFGKLNTRLERAETRMGQAADQYSRLADQHLEVRKQGDSHLGQRFGNLGQRFGNLGQRFGNLEQRFGNTWNTMRMKRSQNKMMSAMETRTNLSNARQELASATEQSKGRAQVIAARQSDYSVGPELAKAIVENLHRAGEKFIERSENLQTAIEKYEEQSTASAAPEILARTAAEVIHAEKAFVTIRDQVREILQTRGGGSSEVARLAVARLAAEQLRSVEENTRVLEKPLEKDYNQRANLSTEIDALSKSVLELKAGDTDSLRSQLKNEEAQLEKLRTKEKALEQKIISTQQTIRKLIAEPFNAVDITGQHLALAGELLKHPGTDRLVAAVMERAPENTQPAIFKMIEEKVPTRLSNILEKVPTEQLRLISERMVNTEVARLVEARIQEAKIVSERVTPLEQTLTRHRKFEQDHKMHSGLRSMELRAAEQIAFNESLLLVKEGAGSETVRKLDTKIQDLEKLIDKKEVLATRDSGRSEIARMEFRALETRKKELRTLQLERAHAVVAEFNLKEIRILAVAGELLAGRIDSVEALKNPDYKRAVEFSESRALKSALALQGKIVVSEALYKQLDDFREFKDKKSDGSLDAYKEMLNTKAQEEFARALNESGVERIDDFMLEKFITDKNLQSQQKLIKIEMEINLLENKLDMARNQGDQAKIKKLEKVLGRAKNKIQRAGFSPSQRGIIPKLEDMENSGEAVKLVSELLDVNDSIAKIEAGERSFWDRLLGREVMTTQDLQVERADVIAKIQKGGAKRMIMEAEGVRSTLIDRMEIESEKLGDVLTDIVEKLKSSEAEVNSSVQELDSKIIDKIVDDAIKTYAGDSEALKQVRDTLIKIPVEWRKQYGAAKGWEANNMQMRLLTRAFELHLLNLELKVAGKDDSIVKQIAGEALLLSMGGGKSAAVMSLELAMDVYRAEYKKEPPPVLYLTANETLVTQIQEQPAMETWKNKKRLVVINEDTVKDVIANGFEQGKVYTMSNEGLKKIVLEMRGQGFTDAQITARFEKIGTAAWDEIHSAFHTTDTILGSSGVWDYLSTTLQKQLTETTINLMDQYTKVMDILWQDLDRSDTAREIFRNQEFQPGQEIRSQFRFNLDYEIINGEFQGKTIRQALEVQKISVRSTGDARFLEKIAQVMYNTNGREYKAWVDENGVSHYGTATNGLGKLNTIYGDHMQSALTHIENIMRYEMKKAEDAGIEFSFKEFNARSYVEKNSQHARSVGEALAHFTTERVTMLEAMNFLGMDKVVGYSGTLKGLEATMKQLGKQVVEISGEPKITLMGDHSSVASGEIHFSARIGDRIVVLDKVEDDVQLRLLEGKSYDQYLVERAAVLMEHGRTQQGYTSNDNKQLDRMAKLTAQDIGTEVIKLSDKMVRQHFEKLVEATDKRVADLEWREGANVDNSEVIRIVVSDILSVRTEKPQVVLIDGMTPATYSVAVDAIKDAIHTMPKSFGDVHGFDKLVLSKECRTSLDRFITKQGTLNQDSVAKWMAETHETSPGIVKEFYEAIVDQVGCTQKRYFFAPAIGEGLNIFATMPHGIKDLQFKAALYKLDLSPSDVFAQAMKRGNVEGKRVFSNTGLDLDINRISNITDSERAVFQKFFDDLDNDKSGKFKDGIELQKKFFSLFDNIMRDYLVEIDTNKAGEVRRTQAGEVPTTEKVSVEKGSDEYMQYMAKKVKQELPGRLREFQGIADLTSNRVSATVLAEKTMARITKASNMPLFGWFANQAANLRSAFKADGQIIGLIHAYTTTWQKMSDWLGTSQDQIAKLKKDYGDNNWFAYAMANALMDDDFVHTWAKRNPKKAGELKTTHGETAWLTYARPEAFGNWINKNSSFINETQQAYKEAGNDFIQYAMLEKFGPDHGYYQTMGKYAGMVNSTSKLISLFGSIAATVTMWRQPGHAGQEYYRAHNNTIRMKKALANRDEGYVFKYQGEEYNYLQARSFMNYHQRLSMEYEAQYGFEKKLLLGHQISEAVRLVMSRLEPHLPVMSGLLKSNTFLGAFAGTVAITGIFGIAGMNLPTLGIGVVLALGSKLLLPLLEKYQVVPGSKKAAGAPNAWMSTALAVVPGVLKGNPGLAAGSLLGTMFSEVLAVFRSYRAEPNKKRWLDPRDVVVKRISEEETDPAGSFVRSKHQEKSDFYTQWEDLMEAKGDEQGQVSDAEAVAAFREVWKKYGVGKELILSQGAATTGWMRMLAAGLSMLPDKVLQSELLQQIEVGDRKVGQVILPATDHVYDNQIPEMLVAQLLDIAIDHLWSAQEKTLLEGKLDRLAELEPSLRDVSPANRLRAYLQAYIWKGGELRIRVGEWETRAQEASAVEKSKLQKTAKLSAAVYGLVQKAFDGEFNVNDRDRIAKALSERQSEVKNNMLERLQAHQEASGWKQRQMAWQFQDKYGVSIRDFKQMLRQPLGLRLLKRIVPKDQRKQLSARTLYRTIQQGCVLSGLAAGAAVLLVSIGALPVVAVLAGGAALVGLTGMVFMHSQSTAILQRIEPEYLLQSVLAQAPGRDFQRQLMTDRMYQSLNELAQSHSRTWMYGHAATVLMDEIFRAAVNTAADENLPVEIREERISYLLEDCMSALGMPMKVEFKPGSGLFAQATPVVQPAANVVRNRRLARITELLSGQGVKIDIKFFVPKKQWKQKLTSTSA
ncbi:hypothetical protein K8S19_11640 [bacterium]|nr:hypothetical protein [bacterium]